MPREHRSELRPRVDAGTDSGAALRQRIQTRRYRRQARFGCGDLRHPGAQLLAECDRHGIHQMGAAGLHHIGELDTARRQHLPQPPQSRLQMLIQHQGSRDVNRGRHDIIAALAHVDLVVRVHGSSQ